MTELTRVDSGLDEPMPAAAVFAPPQPSEQGPSPLEQLRKALAQPVQSEPVVLTVPGRPGVQVRYSTALSNEQRKAWQQRATKKARRQGREDEVDEMRFACLVLANLCQAILFDGVAAHGTDDTPLTFASRELWDMLNVADPEFAIRALYGNDAHVLLSSGEVLLAAGFDDDVASDPTTAS